MQSTKSLARELTLNITAREQQLVRQLQSAKELPLYVTMLGDSGNPLYLVEKGHVKDFKTLLASKAFYMRKSRKPTGQENIPKAEQMTIEKVIEEEDKVPKVSEAQKTEESDYKLPGKRIIHSPFTRKTDEIFYKEPEKELTVEEILGKKPDVIAAESSKRSKRNGKGWDEKSPLVYNPSKNYEKGMWVDTCFGIGKVTDASNRKIYVKLKDGSQKIFTM